LKGTLLLKEKLSLAPETYKEKLSLSVLKLYRNTWKTILFQPEWGVYDTVGKKVVSGPADMNSFDLLPICPPAPP
jgi:hypothetical protein